MDHQQLFAELEEGAIRLRTAYANAWQEIGSNPLLAKLAEMSTQVVVDPKHDSLKGDTPYGLVAWNKRYKGEYRLEFYLPYERKNEVRDLVIDLGLSRKEIHINHHLYLEEKFRGQSHIYVIFYRKVEPGERIGRNGCRVTENVVKLDGYAIACPMKEKADAA